MTELEWLDIFSGNLQDLMQERGYSQRQLADAVGLSDAAISSYIHKQKMPGIRAIVNIAYEFDCDVTDLIDFGDRIEG